MLIPILLIAGQAAAAPPVAGPHDDIVVVGERVRRLKISTRVDRKTGQWGCRVRRSSGDAALDATVCEASIGCARHETTTAGMNGCMQTQMPAIADRVREPASAGKG